MQLKKSFVLLLVVSIVLASCSFASPNSLALQIALERPISTLNYQKSSATSDMEQMSQFMEGLLVFDERGEVAPAGAESWNVSADGLVYRFNLRQDAKWQDGSLVLAQDYYFAWLEIITHKTSPFAYTLFPIKNAERIYQEELDPEAFGVKVLDDFVLEITLEKPYLSFIYSLATATMYPLKQSFYEAFGEERFGTSIETILTNGAYNITHYEPTSQISLAKSETYWGADTVSIPQIDIYIVPEEAARSTLFDEGKLDMMVVSSNYREKYQNKNNQVQVMTHETAQINYLYLSGETLQQNQFLKNEDFRKAIAYALDRNAITENILKDGSIPLTRIVPCAFAFVDGEDYCDITAETLRYTYSTEQAKAHFARAKEAFSDQELTLNIAYQEAANNKLVLENIKFQLETTLPTLKVTLSAFAPLGYSARLREDGTASAIQTWSGSFANPEVYLQILEQTSPFNFAHYDNREFQRLYTTALAATNKREQFQLYGEAENNALGSYMIIPLYQRGVTYILSNRIAQFNYKMTIPNVYYKDIVFG